MFVHKNCKHQFDILLTEIGLFTPTSHYSLSCCQNFLYNTYEN